MLRNIIESARFTSERAVISPVVRSFDEFFTGASFILARDPTCGVQSLTPDVWVMPLRGWKPEHELVIFYRHNPMSVELLSVSEFRIVP